ncbi:DUF6474 family protein [Nocardia amikacinitolerans]|uniref:Uncharacterized protein n=1 Tax=Nocardia amikacinitolerans TaxID=756689 RepID=A0A285LT20_9NOCA|nr:DUF6474 family protein [Nocardia amikacinitolerans]MCP2276791.1 hypothetical protein [Nocardia amikacinitolerans]MCP2291304.1 hypothetical protein [Nocardia amikacinitolerans]MCP2294829.1 hypothetical protein [Nocardia amikacinitolerans]MCP2318535.1 hypothetical protein [Nocardia amikacinitolerans]SNY87257.1 hypothetical protein SAMN04244553_4198 [Nocardia amikacinitolerans]
MGLFTKRKRRPSRRAEAKALKHKAAMEAKLFAKNDRKAKRAEARTQAKVAKAQIATLQAEEKAALKMAAKAERDVFSPGQVRKYLGVARVLVPVLAPLAYRGATFVRGQLDTRRAQQLGIGVDQLGDYTGHGAKLQARIANTEAALGKIDDKGGETQKFVTATRARLDSLGAAVRTAEQMPASRRRAVHTSISHELSGIEADVLARLGVN